MKSSASIVVQRLIQHGTKNTPINCNNLRQCEFYTVKQKTAPVLSHVSILTRDIDIAILPVRNVPVSDENGLTYGHSFFTIL